MTSAVTVVPAELARACNNAHAFLPARAARKHAVMEYDNGRLLVAGSDRYTVGCDFLSTVDFVEGEWSASLDRDALAALEKAAREDKGDEGTLTLTPGDALTYRASTGSETVVACRELTEDEKDFWGDVDALFMEAQERPVTLPICFDPSLLMRFSKVKSDKPERMADFLLTDKFEPALIRIGPNFEGLIMPIDREKHGEAVGEDGLW